MDDRRRSWVPLSQVTARMWALDAMAATWKPRRRLMPALRPAVAALAPRLRRRSRGSAGGRAAAAPPATAAAGSTD